MLEHIRVGLATVLVIMVMAMMGVAIANPDLVEVGMQAQLAAISGGTVEAQPASVVTTSTQATNQTEAAQVGVIDARTAVEEAGPAVVTIVNTQSVNNTGRRFFGPMTATAIGSGVIISNDGYIVTNNHVIENQQSLEVIFSDGTKAAATLVGTDSFSDLAVIKVDTEVPAVAEFGDSDALEPGQAVVAIGSALGDFRNTVTAGVVSALHRDLEDSGLVALQDLIQTDAAINEGNSGGPLLDIEGNVIGINVAVVRGAGMGTSIAEGLGFAIPGNTARQVADQLIANGSVSRPYVGVSYQQITPQMAAYYSLPVDQGLLITAVGEGSPAAQAGIQQGSIITHFDDVELGGEGNSSLEQVLSNHQVGDSVELTVIAPGTGSEQELTLVLGAQPGGQ
jgi:2-alkenal reductase